MPRSYGTQEDQNVVVATAWRTLTYQEILGIRGRIREDLAFHSNIVLSISPSRSRQSRIAKTAKRAIHLGFSGILW